MQQSEIISVKYVGFYVANAKQAASYYITRFGFQPVAYQGLETQHKDHATWVIKSNNVVISLSCPLQATESEINQHIVTHGDGVKDIAFEVSNIQSLVNDLKTKGVKLLEDVKELEDQFGKVLMARIQTFGDIIHTLIQNVDYKGPFLPQFIPLQADPINNFFQPLNITHIDHIVGLQQQSEEFIRWYQENMNFKRFWSVDDKQISTQFSGLRSVVVADQNEIIKIPLIEPAPSPLRKGKGQIQEFLDYHMGPGVQHMALQTESIVEDIATLKKRGVQFLQIPDSYYELLKERLAASQLDIKYSVDQLKENQILIDMDENGYLLQLFSKPCQDRPTFFIELIERHNNNGFGIGNFKSLYEAVEAEQIKRGTLLQDMV